MAASLRSDFRSVWTLRTRRSLADLEFWLIIIGYDTKTHSFPNKGYFFYVILFFGVWIFSVLTLVADFAGKLLTLLPLSTPQVAATLIGVIVLLALSLGTIHTAARRSPFIFSEADATLLSQTPLDRRAVAVVWMLANWVTSGLFVWAVAIILGYALLEAQSVRDLTLSDLPRYMVAGGKALLVFVPLQFCYEALAGAVGAFRLRGRYDQPGVRWIAPGLAVGLVGLVYLTGISGTGGLPGWMWPLSFPIGAGLGGAPLLMGIGVALVWAALGFFVLWRAAEGFNLSRAVEETRGVEAKQAAQLLGMADAAQDMRHRERLGAGRKAASKKTLNSFGARAVLWRNIRQDLRTISFGEVGSWLSILALSVGLQLIPDWGARAVMALTWVFLFGQQAVVPLRRELRRWWLMRQLPFSTGDLAVLDLAGPALIAGGVLALSAIAALFFPVAGLPAAGWLAIPVACGVALAAGVDLLVQCKTDKLMAGNVPEVSLLMIVLGGVVVGLSAAGIWLAQVRWQLPAGMSIGVGLVVCLVVDVLLYGWVRDLAKGMK